MKSLKELYRIGPGPSSSHTMGPQKACLEMLKRCPNADHYRADLYGSLAMTGKGHLSDQIIIRTLPASANIAAETIDSLQWPEVLGTIAGDNTILMIIRSNEEVPVIISRIQDLMK